MAALGRVGASQKLQCSLRDLLVHDRTRREHQLTAAAEECLQGVNLALLARAQAVVGGRHALHPPPAVIVVSSTVDAAATLEPLGGAGASAGAGAVVGGGGPDPLSRLPAIRGHHRLFVELTSGGANGAHVIVPDADSYSLMLFPAHLRHTLACVRSLLVPQFMPTTSRGVHGLGTLPFALEL